MSTPSPEALAHVRSYFGSIYSTSLALAFDAGRRGVNRRSVVDHAQRRLVQMTPEERVEFAESLVAGYCILCGSVEEDDRECRCWNDE